MKLVIQRVKSASVTVDNEVVGSIGKGALVLFGVRKEDAPSSVEWLSNKLVNLRMFSDENDKMNLSLVDIKAEVLIVSQFTLYADCTEGRRPDFFSAAGPELAKPLYERFIAEIRKTIPKVETGIFGAKMEVSLINDGPVTFLIER